MAPTPSIAATGTVGTTVLDGGLTMLSVVRELWAFMRERKKLWLAPIIGILVLVGGLLFLAQGTALAPFIYSIF
jgi:uncharacterized membrane protein YqgA involved in biofilm formation